MQYVDFPTISKKVKKEAPVNIKKSDNSKLDSRNVFF